MHDWLFTTKGRVLQSDKLVDRKEKTVLPILLQPLCNYKI